MPGLSIDTREVRDAAARLRRAGEAVPVGGMEGVQRARIIMERDLKTVAFAGAKARRVGLFLSAPAQFALGVRSGITAASVTSFLARVGAEIVLSVGSSLKHVLWNEVGAEISARPGGALALPTVNALTAGGDLKNAFAGLRSLRDARYQGRKLFVLRRRGSRTAFLAATTGAGAGTVVRSAKTGQFQRGGRILRFFLLIARTHIPARYMVRTARRRVEGPVVEAVGDAVRIRVTQAFA